MNGQAHDTLRRGLRMRKAAMAITMDGESRLQVQGNRIMYGGGDAMRFQFLLQISPPRCLNGVLGVGTSVVGLRRRGGNRARQQLVVGLGHANTNPNFRIKYFELRQQYRSLDGIQPSVNANQRVMISAILPVNADLAHARGQSFIVGKASSTVAIAAQRLGGKKAGAADGGQV